MSTLLRRLLVLAALMFWQGGFTFYAAVVVPIGQAAFGPLDQGLVTRQVTQYLNLAGAVSLLILGWDCWAAGTAGKLNRSRWLFWGAMAAAAIALAGLHLHLDRLLDPDAGRALDRGRFHIGHRWYLWISTVQWACGVAYAFLSLAVWRQRDRRAVLP